MIELNLTGNKLGSETLKHFFNKLKLPALKNLNLSNNEIKQEDLLSLADWLRKENNLPLAVLDLSNNLLGVEKERSEKPQAGLIAFMNALKQKKTLHKLYLSANQIKPPAIEVLFPDEDPYPFSVLDLSFNEDLQNSTIVHFKEIAAHPTLCEINLDGIRLKKNDLKTLYFSLKLTEIIVNFQDCFLPPNEKSNIELMASINLEQKKKFIVTVAQAIRLNREKLVLSFFEQELISPLVCDPVTNQSLFEIAIQANAKKIIAYLLKSCPYLVNRLDKESSFFKKPNDYNESVEKVLKKLPCLDSSKITMSEISLGEGSYGKVILGNYQPDNELQKAVAIKNSLVTYDHNFFWEMHVLAQLQDASNIVKAFGYFNMSDGYGLVLEAYQTNLRVLLNNRFNNNEKLFLEPKDNNHIVLQILNGLSCLHEKGIVHLDFKPENILISQIENQWQVAISDFGSAREVKELAQIKTINDTSEYQGFNEKEDHIFYPPYEIITTYTYRAPEIWQKKFFKLSQEHKKKADVWAFGIIYWEILTKLWAWSFCYGDKLFFSDEERVKSAVLQNKKLDVNNLDQKSQKILASCWKILPENRATIQKVKNDFEKLIQEKYNPEENLHYSNSL